MCSLLPWLGFKAAAVVPLDGCKFQCIRVKPLSEIVEVLGKEAPLTRVRF